LKRRRTTTGAKKKKPQAPTTDSAVVESAVRSILEALGEDTEREGLRETPRRVAELYSHLFEGLGRDAAEDLTVYRDSRAGEIVALKSIPFYSLCEHHLVPFFGRVSIAYAPRGGKIASFGSINRIVEVLAHRPQLQENLTVEIAETIQKSLLPKGVLVIVEAEHLCFSITSTKKPGSTALTSAATGAMKKEQMHSEALSLLKR